MHLAILMTNTDESDFARAHPKDGEKFTSLVHLVRPDWTTEVFSVKDDVFPAGLEWFDGVMITGSPASVHDGAPWIARLTDLIRDIAACGKPIFGACFGHQAVAMALGGEVGPNPGGWVLGLTQMDVVDRPAWAADLGARISQYAAHIEQVTRLPEGAHLLIASLACPLAGFAIGDRVYTTQNHPEMDGAFVADLIAAFRDDFPEEVVLGGLASLAREADTRDYAETIARFFEAAQTAPHD